MTASPSSSTTVRSSRAFGFVIATIELPPREDPRVSELHEHAHHVFFRDVLGQAGQVAHGLDHLGWRGSTVAERPDGHRRRVQQVHLVSRWVEDRVLAVRLTQPQVWFPNGEPRSQRGVHVATSVSSSITAFWTTKAAAWRRDCTPSFPSMF